MKLRTEIYGRYYIIDCDIIDTGFLFDRIKVNNILPGNNIVLDECNIIVDSLSGKKEIVSLEIKNSMLLLVNKIYLEDYVK